MKHRRKSRELAIQILYSYQKNPKPLEELFEDVLFQKTSMDHREYATLLVNGVWEHQKELNRIISEYSKNWNLSRIAVLDRILLQIALFEMTRLEEIPEAVSINEAVELGKKFSTAESGKFLNGILDQFHKDREELNSQ